MNAADPPIRGVRYRNPVWPGLRLEAVPLGTLLGRGPEARFRRPGRPDFHHLLLCTAGAGHHTVDFRRWALSAGRIVHVAPGQVHAFGCEPGLEGVLLLFAPEALPRECASCGTRLPSCLRVEPEDRAWVQAAFEELLAEYERTDGGPVSLQVMQHLLAALVLRLGRLAARQDARVPTVPPAQAELFRLFAAEVERHFRRTRAVSAYARRLGYAERTLARATQAVGGRPPKTFIDDRVLLEAKRLLVHTSLRIGQIAAHLGFSEPTNFTKFFRRAARLSPEAFRRQEQAGVAAPYS